MAIKLEINGEAVYLPPDTKLRLEIVSPLFNFEAIKGTYTFPFDIPLGNPENKKIFGFVHKLDARTSLQKTYPAKLYLGGKLFFSGLLYTLSASPMNLRGHLAVGPGDFARQIEVKTMYELLNNQGSAGSGVSAANSAANGTPDTLPYACFPVENPDLYGVGSASVNTDYLGYMNRWDVAGQTFYSNPTPGLYENTLAFFPYAVYFLQECFNDHGYSVGGDWYEDAEIRTLCHYNNHAQDRISGGANVYTDTLYLKDLAPGMLIKDYLKAMRMPFCMSYIFHPRQKHVDIVSMKWVLAQTGYKDWNSRIIPKDYEFTQDASGFTFSFDKDSTENETEVYRYENFENVTQEYTEEFGTLPGSPGDDGDMIWDTWYNQFRIYDEQSGEWDYYSENSYPKIVGDGANDMVSPISPLQAIIEDPAHPYIRNVGNSVFHALAGDTEEKPFGLRMTFFRGKYDYGSGDVPVGCSRDADIAGNTWNYSLFWNGDKGLCNIWWKGFTTMMMNAKRVKIRVRLTTEDLFNFSPTEKVRVGASIYLVQNLSLMITGQNIMYGEATLYKIL